MEKTTMTHVSFFFFVYRINILLFAKQIQKPKEQQPKAEISKNHTKQKTKSTKIKHQQLKKKYRK